MTRAGGDEEELGIEILAATAFGVMAKKAFLRRLWTKGRRPIVSKRTQRLRGDQWRPMAPETATTADRSHRMWWRPRVQKERQSPAGFDHEKTAAGVEGDTVMLEEEVAWLDSDQHGGE
ncbi:hypothetical protein E2562_024489 [Oryza meyeriana var. granulata]|uniref:Uncharacterized protein n=1 Tax=Oryza meyeriana var. granulata TaxID=110450 RepID=A0A6G1FBR5_9ORYZ|nr:hypothetical protein E2562_024489 [Oryza meyeriana var. granulata]